MVWHGMYDTPRTISIFTSLFQLINAMMNKLDIDEKLEQDDFEGVDEDEWVS